MKIRHNQLISIIDVVDDIDTPFICMEAAEHTAEVVVRSAQRGNQHVATTLDLISAVASALAYLHRQGCIHRDVKPANILWIGNRWVLGDLGIVKWSDVNPLFTIPGAQTSDRAHVGAWQYMAPEQGQPPYRAVPASDIYALGITWFELCEGYRPCPQAVGAGRLNFRAGSAQVERLIQAMTQYDAHLRPSIDTILTSLKSFKSVPGPIYTLRHSKSANGK